MKEKWQQGKEGVTAGNVKSQKVCWGSTSNQSLRVKRIHMDIRDVKRRYMMSLGNELICCTFADGHVNAYELAALARKR